MLRQLHNKKIQKRIWIILAILILPAFTFWGAGSAMRGSRDQRFAGTIAGKEVSLPEFQDALIAIRNQALLIWGDDFFKVEKQLNLEAQAWERLLLVKEVKKRKIKVSDEQVGEFIQGLPFFQKNGKFDMVIYERLLRFMFGTPTRIFEEQIRDNLAIRKLYESITSGVSVSDEEIKNEYKKDNEEARVEYLSALPQDYAASVAAESGTPADPIRPGVGAPDDKEIEDYFNKNSLEFKKPETFNLEYAELLYPQDAKAEQTGEIDGKAKDIFLKLRNNKDFSAAAKAAGLEAKDTGFFTLNQPIPGIGWSAEIIDILTRLTPEQPAVPVHTAKGWYFLQLKEKKPPYVPVFAEIKEQVREKLILQKAKQIAREKIEAAYAKIKETDKESLKSLNLDRMAEEFNLKTGKTEFFKRSSYIPGIGISDKFFDIVSSLKAGEMSIILETEQGFYIVRLKDWKGIDEAEYLKEKEKLSSRVLEFKKQSAFSAFLEQLQKGSHSQLSLSPQAEKPLPKK